MAVNNTQWLYKCCLLPLTWCVLRCQWFYPLLLLHHHCGCQHHEKAAHVLRTIGLGHSFVFSNVQGSPLCFLIYSFLIIPTIYHCVWNDFLFTMNHEPLWEFMEVMDLFRKIFMYIHSIMDGLAYCAVCWADSGWMESMATT